MLKHEEYDGCNFQNESLDIYIYKFIDTCLITCILKSPKMKSHSYKNIDLLFSSYAPNIVGEHLMNRHKKEEHLNCGSKCIKAVRTMVQILTK